MNNDNLLSRSFAEFLGTFFLVFAGTGTIIADSATSGGIGHIGISIVFGLVVMAMIYAVGDISGAHINPAVSFAFWTAGMLKTKEMIWYAFFQFLGAIAASFVLWLFFPAAATRGETIPQIGIWQTFAFEVILSFLLMFVILHVSTGNKEKGLLAGVAVGGTVLMEAMFAGPLTGASMNPARSLGPAVVAGNVFSFWIYFLAPLAGMWLAVLSCRILRKDCCQITD